MQKRFGVAAAVAVLACTRAAGPGSGVPPPSSQAGAAGEMLAESRVRSVARNPDEWLQYLGQSRAQRRLDSTAMAAELAQAGLTKMTQAPYIRAFEITDSMTPAWFGSDSARIIGD